MKRTKNKRSSHCAGCGKRLSEKTESGDIKWQPSQVDDQGIYCLACRPKNAGKKPKSRK